MFAKLLILFFYKDTLLGLLGDIKSFWHVQDVTDSSLRESIQSLFSSTNSIFRIVLGIFFMLQIPTVLKPYMYRDKLLIPAGVYSYSPDNHGLYVFVCSFQQILSLTTTFYAPSMDMIYIGSCTSLMAQFKMLRGFLETANQRGSFIQDIGKAVEQHNLLFR